MFEWAVIGMPTSSPVQPRPGMLVDAGQLIIWTLHFVYFAFFFFFFASFHAEGKRFKPNI